MDLFLLIIDGLLFLASWGILYGVLKKIHAPSKMYQYRAKITDISDLNVILTYDNDDGDKREAVVHYNRLRKRIGKRFAKAKSAIGKKLDIVVYRHDDSLVFPMDINEYRRYSNMMRSVAVFVPVILFMLLLNNFNGYTKDQSSDGLNETTPAITINEPMSTKDMPSSEVTSGTSQEVSNDIVEEK